MKKLTVIDFFCGAGGFSEGFRQQGFHILRGFDKWEPAVKTFNHNFSISNDACDILGLAGNLQSIEELQNSDIIIGSPPCVSFSNSNKSGKADKSLGVRLTEAFLKIVVVKKFQKDSILRAWFMENVPNSLKHLQGYYTFKDLDLEEWAKKNNYNASHRVITINGNSVVLNAAEYGSPQSRKRAITGEFIAKKKFICPTPSYTIGSSSSGVGTALTLESVKTKLPSPTSKNSNRKIVDPMYPAIKIKLKELTDHFYDTGLYESQWKHSHFMKRNHPFMGRMSFPENEKKPSRTITATNIGTSREAIIYKSSYNRKGDGEYRGPTVREMACLMGFPITYQFLGGSEYSKCRLAGNAVCISISRTLAKLVRKELGLKEIMNPIVQPKIQLQNVLNLNTFKEKCFDNPPKKNKGSRFRRHPFKDGNITVTLSNYDVTKNVKKKNKWFTSVQFGNGKGFPTFNYPDRFYTKIEPVIRNLEKGVEFLNIVNNGFSEQVANGMRLQKMYENQKSEDKYLEPTLLVERIAEIIQNLKIDEIYFEQNGTKYFKKKNQIPVKQLYALYAINKITSLANRDKL